MTWFYISFADRAGFRGGTVVEANDDGDAVHVATARKLNPGGEAMVVQVPADKIDAPDIVGLRYRLADKTELLGGGGFVAPHRHGAIVCEQCNEEEVERYGRRALWT